MCVAIITLTHALSKNMKMLAVWQALQPLIREQTPIKKQLRLLPPWTFVGFEIPEWEDYENIEPVNVGGIPVDLAVEDAGIEGLVESQEYGASLIATAYGPWMDLLDALCSLEHFSLETVHSHSF